MLTICLFDYYVKPISVTRTAGNYFTRDSVRGPCTYSHSFSQKLSSEMSSEITASTGLTTANIASKLGARLVDERIFTRGVSIPLPRGDWSVYAFPEYNTYRFELWREGIFGDTKIGTYTYNEPTGIGTYHQKTPRA